MSVLAISRVNFLLMIRDRSNLITMLTLPMLFIFLIGTQFGGEQRPTVMIERTGDASDQLAATLADGDTVEVRRAASTGEARDAVAAGEAALGVVVPDDIVDRVLAGEGAEIGIFSDPDGFGAELRPVVADAIGDLTLVPSAVAALAESSGVSDGELTAAVEAVADDLGSVPVTVVDPQGGEVTAEGRFDESAPQQLVLMVFLFTLFSAVPMAQTRLLGVTHRMTVSPTSTGSIVIGEALGRWVVAIAQGAYIVAGTAIVFNVDWGSLWSTVIVLAVFGAVGAGAGMLLGSLLTNDGVIVGVGSVVGLTVAALGGAMVPREVFSSTMSTVSRFTPHSWALDAFAELRQGGTVVDVWAELAVLAAAAAVLLAMASWRLRVVLRSD